MMNILRRALRITALIIALIAFPVTTILYLIWPSRLFKERMSKGWRQFWWAIYVTIAICNVTLKVAVFVVYRVFNTADTTPVITREGVCPATYRSCEDFYKLTGVEFPELEMVDSLYYDDMWINPNTYYEYKFVAKEGLSRSFYRGLDQACESDPTHWQSDKERAIYEYCIYPDTTPVDRSRGSCDRMVTMDDGSEVIDWDGSYIAVEIRSDTIILREGWSR